MHETGKKSVKGSYQYTTSSEIVVLDDDTDTLPPCQKCHKTADNKL